MIDLYLVRHGESQANKDGVLCGRTDTPLSEKWQKQSQALCEYLTEISLPCDVVYSSPLQRAQNTIFSFAQSIQREIILDERLTEIDLWSRENTKIPSVLTNEYHEDSYYFSGEKRDIETYAQVVQRVREFLEYHVYTQTGMKIMVSCHAGVLRAFVAALNELTREVPKLQIQNASFTHYKIDEMTRIARCERFCYDMYLRDKDLI